MQPLVPAEPEQIPAASGCEPIQPWRPDRFSSWILAIGFFLISVTAFAHRHTMNPDALSYLEVGEAWLRGDFKNAVNGYWNPLYSILTAVSAKLSGPARFEAVGPHVLTVVLYVVAVFGFLSFMRALLRNLAERGVDPTEARSVLLPVSSAIFVWATVYLIDPAYCMPDLLVLVWVLFAASAWLRIPQEGLRAGILFGLYLALGYLTKPVMFPLGIIFLAASAIPVRLESILFKRTVTCSMLAAAVFLALSSLYIIPLSLQKGRLTFSESGGLAYAWEVNGVSPYFHWQGDEPGSGKPAHPTRRILDSPPAYEFDAPRPGTYSPWFDPSYWNEGLKGRFNPRDQLNRLKISASFYADLFLRQPVPLILGFALLTAFFCVGWRSLAFESSAYLALLLPCLAAFAMYALVFAISRYLAPFALLPGILLAAACLRAGIQGRAVRASSTAFVVVALLFVSLFSARSVAREVRHSNARSYRIHRLVADQLKQLGLMPGDKIAVIGTGCESYYARIARLRIVAETLVFPGHPEWPASSENLARIVQAFAAKTPAKAVVSDVQPLEEIPAWIDVPGTPYRILLLDRN